MVADPKTSPVASPSVAPTPAETRAFGHDTAGPSAIADPAMPTPNNAATHASKALRIVVRRRFTVCIGTPLSCSRHGPFVATIWSQLTCLVNMFYEPLDKFLPDIVLLSQLSLAQQSQYVAP
jgi:hypothetical protein